MLSIVSFEGPVILDSIGCFIFSVPEVPLTPRSQMRVRGAWVQAEEGWTKRRTRDTTASSPPDHHLHAVEPDDAPPLWGLECLPADLCRALGRVCPRPSPLSDTLLRGPGGQDAGVWQPGADGLCRIPLPAVWPGYPSRGDELQIGAVLTLRQSPCRQLGQPGEPGPPRGGVAYPRPADKYLGPLVSRLSGVNQPVISTRNAFSTPRLTPLACV